MKKLVFLSVLICFFGMCSVSLAYIDKRKDSFDGSIVVSSYNKLETSEGLQLYKIIKKEGIEYSVLISSNAVNKYDMYAKQDADLKIDSELFKAVVLKASIKRNDYSADRINVEICFTPEQIDKMKYARDVRVRVQKEDGGKKVINIPDSVLAEWKQVIATEE